MGGEGVDSILKNQEGVEMLLWEKRHKIKNREKSLAKTSGQTGQSGQEKLSWEK